MGKKKVMFVFYQSKSQANGGINSLWQLIKSFDAIDAVLLTNMRTKVVEEAEAVGYEVQITPNKDSFSLWAKLYNVFFWSLTLFRALRKSSALAIHFNDIMALSYGVFFMKCFNFFKIKGKTKIIFNIRDVFEPHRKYTKKWKLVNFCDDIIVLSAYMKEQLYQRLPLKNKDYWQNHIHAIYSIVDHERFSPVEEGEKQRLRKKLNMDANKLHWAYVATFNTKKNQLGFIEALQEQMKTCEVVIHFVGDINRYAEKCQALVGKFGLATNCMFHGYYSQVEDFYKAADLTIVPTMREGLARCMIESISCGKPVISFDVSSAREILEEHQCGIVVNQGSYDTFFQKAFKLSYSEQQLQEFSKNGLTLARQIFSKPTIVASYQDIYLDK